jgi:hypothetical protein
MNVLFCKADHDVVERASTKENGVDDINIRNNKNTTENLKICIII